jgi:hypothetical protein
MGSGAARTLRRCPRMGRTRPRSRPRLWLRAHRVLARLLTPLPFREAMHPSGSSFCRPARPRMAGHVARKAPGRRLDVPGRTLTAPRPLAPARMPGKRQRRHRRPHAGRASDPPLTLRRACRIAREQERPRGRSRLPLTASPALSPGRRQDARRGTPGLRLDASRPPQPSPGQGSARGAPAGQERPAPGPRSTRSPARSIEPAPMGSGSHDARASHRPHGLCSPWRGHLCRYNQALGLRPEYLHK